MSANKKWASRVVIAAMCLLVYLGSYGLLRQTKGLVHTYHKCENHHDIEAWHRLGSLPTMILESTYWPLRKAEIRYHQSRES